MKIVKPGSRVLIAVGITTWLLSFFLWRHTSVEFDLFDAQHRLIVKKERVLQRPSELVVAAIDREALQAGWRPSDLAFFAARLGPNAVDITTQDLTPFFEPDSDGKLRSIRLFRKDTELTLAPPLIAYLNFLGVSQTEVKVESQGLTFPGGFLPTDSTGRYYPLFPEVHDYDYIGQKMGAFSRLFLAPRPNHKETDETRFLSFDPVSVERLQHSPAVSKDRLTILGRFLAEADEIEFTTPSGDMARLELYGSVLSNFLSGNPLRPLDPRLAALLQIAAVILLGLVLPGQRTTAALGWWLAWLGLWLGCNHALFAHHLFMNQSATIMAGLFMLLTHLLLRSRRVNTLLQGLGGRSPLQKSGREISATILFTNLPDTIKQLEETEPEEAQAARVAHSRCVGRIVDRHGGRLVDLQGDAQMIAFGLEGGNHQQQAAACALEIVDKVNQLLNAQRDEPNQVFCGIVTGPVATGQVGGGKYHGVAAIGDTTNSAARLMGQAKKRKKAVLASAETVSKLGPRALLERVGELSVKGRSEPIKTWEIQGYSAPPEVRIRPYKRTQNMPKLIFLATTIASLTTAAFLSTKPTLRNPFLDAVTPSLRSSPILFAGLDRESLDFHPWPWPRSLHAEIAKNCLQAQAQCVFIDFLFEEPSEPLEDEALVEVVSSDERVIVAAAALNDRGVPEPPVLLDGLLESEHWGLINHAPSNQGETLRFGLWQLPLGREKHLVPGVAKKMLQVVDPARADMLQGDYEFLIRWGPKPRTISYSRLLDPSDPIFDELSGKTVIIGDNLEGRSDAFETPVGTLKGAMIHALSLQTLINGEVLSDVSHSAGVVVACWLISVLVLMLSWRTPGIPSQLAILTLSLACTGLLVDLAAKAGYFVGPLPCVTAATTVVFAWVISVMDTNQALTNYIPRKLQEQLEKDGSVADINTTGTILLTDIRGYTTLSEGRSPSEILTLLNSYHQKTAAVYERFGGHLLTYQGDAQIVVFGPLDRIDNPVLAAVRAARMLPPIVEEVAREAGLERGVLRVGSGITTGGITLSLMGAKGQLQYSVFGAPVRQAHHLQSLSDSVQDNIMLDEPSTFAVKDILRISTHHTPQGETFYTTEDA